MLKEISFYGFMPSKFKLIFILEARCFCPVLGTNTEKNQEDKPPGKYIYILFDSSSVKK